MKTTLNQIIIRILCLSLLAGVFGNVTVIGRFSGIIGDAGTAAGKGNTLTITVRGGGGIVTPAKAFATYYGYP